MNDPIREKRSGPAAAGECPCRVGYWAACARYGVKPPPWAARLPEVRPVRSE
jgi:hypothetical protein